MRGLTEQEAEILRTNVASNDPADGETLDESHPRRPLNDALVARGLLTLVAETWTVPTEDGGVEHWEGECYRTTALGHLALTCHVADRMIDVLRVTG